MGDIAENFLRTDFQCRCSACSSDGMRPATNSIIVQAVQRLRNIIGAPLTITRGVSCAAHNAAIGGAADSRHLPEHADAVDIQAGNSIWAMMIVQAAMTIAEFTTFRVYEHHVHLDGRLGPRRFLSSPE